MNKPAFFLFAWSEVWPQEAMDKVRSCYREMGQKLTQLLNLELAWFKYKVQALGLEKYVVMQLLRNLHRNKRLLRYSQHSHLIKAHKKSDSKCEMKNSHSNVQQSSHRCINSNWETYHFEASERSMKWGWENWEHTRVLSALHHPDRSPWTQTIRLAQNADHCKKKDRPPSSCCIYSPTQSQL